MEAMVTRAMALLETEAELVEIVRLVGAEAISAADRLALETARTIREDFLHQNAFHKVDTHTSITKQYEMLKTILHFHNQASTAIEHGTDPAEIFKLAVREEIARAKYIPENEAQKITKIRATINEQIKQLQAVSA